jgi:hypothetical protein
MKIHDSKGKLYYICPFLAKIENILAEKLAPEDMFEIRRHLDSIEAIAKNLRGEDVGCGELNYERIHSPYNFSAVIKQLKILSKTEVLTETKIDEIIKTYL